MKITRFFISTALALALGLPARVHADAAAEQAASELLEMRMKNQRPEDHAILRAVEGKEIVVVLGSMDKIQSVLRAARIPYTLIGPGQVASQDLHADQILMINCPGNIPRAGIRRIQQFVSAGGLLYTTDWALANVVQKAFPGTIASNHHETDDHVTPVEVHAHDDNLMSQLLLRRDGKPQWWLEGGSYPVQILDRERVEVLASSKQMKRRYGAAPVVVRFRWEDGQVIHVVSHFYRQAQVRGPRVAAAKALQNVSGLTASQQQAFGSGTGGAQPMAEVESSYAFQQMTSNLIVGKNKQNKKLDQAYTHEIRAPMKLGGQQAPARRRVKVLQRENGKVQVRDDRGFEAWVHDEDLARR